MIVAKDLMQEAVTVPATMLVADLVKILREKRIGGVPVVDKNHKVVGIVSVADVFKVMRIVRSLNNTSSSWFSNFAIGKKTIKVDEIYTREPITALPETPVEEIIEIMLEKGLQAIPVMDKDRKTLYGVVGRHDVTFAALGNIDPPK